MPFVAIAGDESSLIYFYDRRFYAEINQSTSKLITRASHGIVHARFPLFYLIRSVRINLDIVSAAAVDIGGR